MNKIMELILVVVVIAIIAIAYLALSGKSPYKAITSTTIMTENQSTSTSSAYTSTIMNVNSSNNSTAQQTPVVNKTLTITQVISTLGTGWTAASQYNYGTANVTLPYGPNEYVSGYGIANFSKGGTFLTTEWFEFKNIEDPKIYVNSTYSPPYPISSRQTGSTGNATYVLYSGDSINNGQAALAMAAYYKNYVIVIINNGTTFPKSLAEQLLNYQISDFNATT